MNNTRLDSLFRFYDTFLIETYGWINVDNVVVHLLVKSVTRATVPDFTDTIAGTSRVVTVFFTKIWHTTLIDAGTGKNIVNWIPLNILVPQFCGKPNFSLYTFVDKKEKVILTIS